MAHDTMDVYNIVYILVCFPPNARTKIETERVNVIFCQRSTYVACGHIIHGPYTCNQIKLVIILLKGKRSSMFYKWYIMLISLIVLIKLFVLEES